MRVIYGSEYVQYLHIKQTIPSEYVMGILCFTKQLVYVGSFINTFYKGPITENSLLLPVSRRELQTENQWSPPKSTYQKV